MANLVRNSMASALKLMLAIFSLASFYTSQAQCIVNPGVIDLAGPNAGFKKLGTYNGHTYYISVCGGDNGDGLFRGSQILNAVAGTGGYAAAIFDINENNWIRDAVIGYNQIKYGGVGAGKSLAYGGGWDNTQNPWIGYTDIAVEQQWKWMNQQECNNFTNWNINEPNNFVPAIGEDYTEMLIMVPYDHDNNPATPLHDPLGKWNDWYNDQIPYKNFEYTRLPIVLEVGPSDCETETGNQGCTLGYWKNHEEDWPATGYSTGQTLESVWDVPNSLGMDNTTLMEALNFGGGPGVLGGARNLFKQAVAALLNAAHPDVDYPLTVAQVISQVNTALATNNRNAMLALAGTLDGYNNLHGNSLCGNSTSRQPGGSLTNSTMDQAFAVSGYPNPTRSNFSIQINGLSTENISVRVTDMTGRLIEQRTNVPANQTLQIGSTYKAGLYYVEVMQGASKKQLKLVKQ